MPVPWLKTSSVKLARNVDTPAWEASPYTIAPADLGTASTFQHLHEAKRQRILRPRTNDPQIMSGYPYGYYYQPNDQTEYGFDPDAAVPGHPPQGGYITDQPAVPAGLYGPVPTQYQGTQVQRPHPQRPSAPIYQQPIDYAAYPYLAVSTPIVPSNYPALAQQMNPFISEIFDYQPRPPTTRSHSQAMGHLFPESAAHRTTRPSRATSLTSVSSARSHETDISRTTLPTSQPAAGLDPPAQPSTSEMGKWGVQNTNGTWSCAYPTCTSRSTFSRGCDLRKHYKYVRHLALSRLYFD